MINIRYASIRSMDISNGEGIGVALFVQGCHFRCKNCFNPETWDFDGGKEWTPKVKKEFLELIDKPYIKRVSILGGEPLADENLDDVLDLVTEVNRRYNEPQYIDDINDNNRNILSDNADEIRLSCSQKTIWLYTGYTWENIFTIEHMKKEENIFLLWNKRAEIISKCDVLVDGRYIDSQRDITVPYRGSKNQRLINIQKSLQKGEIVLWQT